MGPLRVFVSRGRARVTGPHGDAQLYEK